jgi:hypothetical protein
MSYEPRKQETVYVGDVPVTVNYDSEEFRKFEAGHKRQPGIFTARAAYRHALEQDQRAKNRKMSFR